jgi:hypothetical protein
MPDRRKSVAVKVTNHSVNVLSLGISLRSRYVTSKDPSKEPPFKMREKILKLLPYESKPVPIMFEPKMLGHFTDVLSVGTSINFSRTRW